MDKSLIMKMSLEKRLAFRLPLELPGNTDAASSYGGYLNVWSFTERSTMDWYNTFREDLLATIGRRFYPIYRMADGEFRFLLGHTFNFKAKNLLKEFIYISLANMGLDVRIIDGRIAVRRSFTTSWGEAYAKKQRKLLRWQYIKMLQQLSLDGSLALFLMDSASGICSSQLKPICRFLDGERINLHLGNYVPFHFPTYLLCGPSCNVFYHNRNLLFVSSLGHEERIKLKEYILALGAKSVQFISISENKSLLDTIDCRDIHLPIDICLVAAGIGSANILLQLRSLETIAIDIGGFINCLIEPNRVYHGFIRAPLIGAYTNI